MKTINKIIKDNWFTRTELSIYRKKWITNWMWWKWWIKFTKELAKLPWFKRWYKKQLLIDMDLVSDMHDIRFHIWWWFKSFLRANWNFAANMIRLFHWSTFTSRFLLFTTLFIWTTLVGWRYFNWTKIL